MNKSELVKAIAEKAGLTQTQAKSALEAAIGSVTTELAGGGKVALPGFATISVAVRPARQGKNPASGEIIEIPAKNVVKFKAGKELDEAVNG